MTKSFFLVAFSLFLAVPAMADVDTVCTGGGPRGNKITIEIAQVMGEIGSQCDKAIMNGIKTPCTFQGEIGGVMRFELEGSRHVFGLEYNQGEATARFTAQGEDVAMYCSRL